MAGSFVTPAEVAKFEFMENVRALTRQLEQRDTPLDTSEREQLRALYLRLTLMLSRLRSIVEEDHWPNC